MELSYHVFRWLCFAVGAIALLAMGAYALAVAVVFAFKVARVWNVLRLAVAIRLHGKNYKDQVFWLAVKEKAERSEFSARNIADFALSHSPNKGGAGK